MSAGEGDWSSPHWNQGARGGRQGGGRSGLGDTDFKKSQERFGNHQHDDRRQQGPYQGERGFSHRGQHQGRPYGNIGQQDEGFPSHHQDQRRQGYSHHGQRENRAQASFRGPPNFHPAESRSTGYMHYYQEPMMAGHPRAPEHWQGGPLPPYHQPPVSPEGIHPYFTRPTTFVDQQQYRATQPFPQHQVTGGHHTSGAAIGAGGAMAVGGSATMHGQVYHPNNVRPSQHADAWSSGAPVPEYRSPEAVRGANSGSGRGGGGGGGGGGGRVGGHGRGSSSGGSVSGTSSTGTNARRGSRAPPVPQPVVPHATPQTEPVNSGILSLGRPRQQPSRTVNNVQSARGANVVVAQAHGSINGASNEAAPATAGSQQQADNAAGLEPATFAEVPTPTVDVEEELSLQDRSDKPPPAPSEPELHPSGALSATSREAGSAIAETTLLAGSAATSGGDTENSSCYDNASARSVSQSGNAAACASGDVLAIGSTSISGPQEIQAVLNGSAAVPAPQSLSAASPPSAPLEVAVAASCTPQTSSERPVAFVGGSAWKQRPATALFTSGSPSAGAQITAHKAGAQAAHPSPNLQGPSSAGTVGTSAVAGAQPTTVPASAQSSSLVAHQNIASPVPPSSTAAGPPRVQNRPAPVQTGPAQGPRCPPPGFGSPPGAAMSPVDAGTAPSEHATTSQKPEYAPKPQPTRQQLSPRVSGGSDALESVASAVRAAQVPQHSLTSASTTSTHAAPSSADFPEAASKANRKWSSVVATHASNEGAHKKAPARRPTSEGGGSDVSANVAAATLVGLRHATQHSHGAPSDTPAASISGGETDREAAGHDKFAHGSGILIGTTITAMQDIANGEATVSKESDALEAVVAGTAAREGRAAQNPQAGPQLGSVSSIASSGPESLLMEFEVSCGVTATAAVVAATALSAPPRDTAAMVTTAASAALASPPREAPSGPTPTGNGAAAESVSNPGVGVTPITWAGRVVSSANNARPSKGAGARPKQVTKGNGLSGHFPTATAEAVSGSEASAAVPVKAAAAPTPVNMGAEPPAAMTTVAAGSVTPDTLSTNAVTLGEGGCTNAAEKTFASGDSLPTPVPAAEAALSPGEEAPSDASQTGFVGLTAEALTALNSPAEASAQGPSPAPPTGKTWAGLVSSNVPARPLQQNRVVAAPAAPSAVKRHPVSQSRGSAGRGSRHPQPSHRTVSAQPPEMMFHTHIGALAAQAVHGTPDRKASEDGHGAPKLGPSSSKLQDISTSPIKPMSPTSSVELNLTLPSVAAAARPAAPTPAPVEPSADSAAPSGVQEEAHAPTADTKLIPCGTGGTPVSPSHENGLQASSSRAVAAGTATVSTTAVAAETTAAVKPRDAEETTDAVLRQYRKQDTALASSLPECSKSGIDHEGLGVPEANPDGDGWQLAGGRHKGGKGARGADSARDHPVPSTGSGTGRGHDRVPTSASHPPHQKPQLLAAAGKSRGSAPPTVEAGAAAAAIPPASSSTTSRLTTSMPGNVGSAGSSAPQGAKADAGRQAVAATTPEPPAVLSVTVSASDVAKCAAGAAVTSATLDVATARSDTETAPVDVAPMPAATLEPTAMQEAAPTDVEVTTRPDEVASAAPVDRVPSHVEPTSDATVGPEQEVEPSPEDESQLQAQVGGRTDTKDDAQSAPQPAAREDPGKTEGDADEDDIEESAAVPAGRNPWVLLEAAGEDGGEATPGAAAASVSDSGAAVLVASAEGSPDAGIAEALRQLLTPATGDQLRQQQQSGGFRIQPRGLANTGNTCFINATMQALLACTPFAFMLSRLPVIAPLLEPSKSPTLHALALFLADLASPHAGASSSAGSGTAGSGREDTQQAAEDDGWAEVPSSRARKGGQRKGAAKQTQQPASSAAPAPASGCASSAGKGEAAGSPATVLGGQPLVPSMLNGIAAAFNPRISIAEKQTMAKVLSKGVVDQEQQDAQEFFQFLVNKVHEEVVALRKAHGLTAMPAASGEAGGDDGEEWAQVGRKNKATVTRQVGTPAEDAGSRSPVTAIFSGLLKSTVRFQQPNYKPSATIEAFNMLHLDIAAEGVNTLEDALRQHSVAESIEYKPDGATEMLPAKKDVRLCRLPEVLVLHLKRFTYTVAGGGRYTKVQKPVTFNCTLRLEGKILAEDCPDRANSEYRLFATINHHGRTIAGGHYMADVLQPDGHWLRFNDAEVFVVQESAVLGERPYLLFYQRVPQRGA